MFLMMKRYLYIGVLLCVMVSCGTHKMPPFATSGAWQLEGNEVVNTLSDMRIDFGGGNRFPLTNASNGDYDLHFITSDADFASYDPACVKNVKDVMKAIPFKVDSVELILADQFMVLSTSMFNQCVPDYARRADGAWLVVEANPVTSEVQPHDELWRNLVFNNGKRRITVIDRIIKNGHHYAIVYVMQSEKKGVSCATAFKYDILNRQNVEAVGTYLEYLLHISEAALESTAK